MRVLAERDLFDVCTEQPREARPDVLRPLFRLCPFVIDQFRRIQPRLLLRIERHVRPGLVGMAGQQQALGDAEAGVVEGERGHWTGYGLPASGFGGDDGTSVAQWRV